MFETYEDYIRSLDEDAKKNPMPEREEEKLCPCGDPVMQGNRWCGNCWESADMIARRLVEKRVAAGIMPDDAFEDILRAYDSLTDNVGHFDDSKPWVVANVNAAAKKIAYVNDLKEGPAVDLLGDVLDMEWQCFYRSEDKRRTEMFDKLRGHSAIFREIPYHVGKEKEWAEEALQRLKKNERIGAIYVEMQMMDEMWGRA